MKKLVFVVVCFLPAASDLGCLENSETVDAVCGNGVVEANEACDGQVCCTPTCSLKSLGTVCREAAGPCDAAETCDGATPVCPDDAYAQNTTCRASDNECDLPEICSGASALCPADAKVADGAACSLGSCLGGSCQRPFTGKVYYVSPNGNDSADGESQATALATFDKAWTKLSPGDTLLLMDGVYLQTLAPNGQDGQANPDIDAHDYQTYPLDHPLRTKYYISIRALNDGRAIIDGQGTRPTVRLGNYQQQSVGHYYIVEGIVAMNSSESVYLVQSRNVILRRDSGYNANTNFNEHVFTIDVGCCDANSINCDAERFCTTDRPSNILVEDCIGAGTGRKMFMAYGSYVNVVLRRNFAAWTSWRGGDCGQDECAAHWPWGDGIEVYNWPQPDLPDGWVNSRYENNIVYGRLAKWGFSLSPNPTQTFDNQFIGDIAVQVGMDWDKTQMSWLCPNPVQTWFPCPKWTEWQAMRSGFGFGAHGNSLFKDNLFQDLFAFGNAGVGIATGPYANGSANNRLIRGTFIHNGLASNLLPGEAGQDVSPVASLDNVFTQDVYLSTNPDPAVEKARLTYRYVNGVYQDGSNGKTPQKLWPWPMEERVMAEMAQGYAKDDGPNLDQSAPVVWNNFSVTDTICEKILKVNGVVESCQ